MLIYRATLEIEIVGYTSDDFYAAIDVFRAVENVKIVAVVPFKNNPNNYPEFEY